MRRAFACFVLGAALLACGDSTPSPGTPSPSTPSPSPEPKAQADGGDHGAATDLGHLTLAGRRFGMELLGEVVPGEECAIEVHPENLSLEEAAALNLYLWVESRDGTQLSAAGKGEVEGHGLHFHVTPRKGDKVAYRAVLRLRAGDVDERASLPLDGHGHEHPEAPHQGSVATFSGGDVSGYLELRVADGAPALELWLGVDEGFDEPFDLPVEAAVEVEFVDVDGKKVVMRARDTERNADSTGQANVRGQGTNYFAYPSVAGEDASWLGDAGFSSIVIVRFERDGVAFESAELVAARH